MDHDALFPLAPINAAEEKLQSLFSSANDALASLTKHFEQQCLPSQSLNGDSASASDTADRQRLHATVERLQAELGVLSLLETVMTKLIEAQRKRTSNISHKQLSSTRYLARLESSRLRRTPIS